LSFKPDSPHLLLTLSAVFWAGTIVFSKNIIESLPPFTLSLGRFSTALIVLLPWMLKKGSFSALKDRQLLVRLVLLGFFGVFLFNSFLYMGLRHTSAINATLINSLNPVLVALLSVVWLKDKITHRQIIGLIISVSGILWIESHGKLNNIVNIQFNPGDVFILIAAFFWAYYSNLAKLVMQKIPAMEAAALALFTGVIFLIPVSIVELHFTSSIDLGWETIITVLYLGIFSSFVALYFWFYGIDKLGGARAANYYNLIPFFGIIMAVIFLGEKVYPFQLVGGALILAGVYYSSRSKKAAPEPLKSVSVKKITES